MLRPSAVRRRRRRGPCCRHAATGHSVGIFALCRRCPVANQDRQDCRKCDSAGRVMKTHRPPVIASASQAPGDARAFMERGYRRHRKRPARNDRQISRRRHGTSVIRLHQAAGRVKGPSGIRGRHLRGRGIAAVAAHRKRSFGCHTSRSTCRSSIKVTGGSASCIQLQTRSVWFCCHVHLSSERDAPWNRSFPIF